MMKAVRHVLLVEDDVRIATALGIRLKSGGYQVIQAGTVKDAEKTLSEGLVQVALVDINLPDGNGVDLVSRLRTEYGSVAPPAIVMSASRQPGLADAARQAGAIAFLEKPFNSAVLLDLLDGLLDRCEPDRSETTALFQDCPHQPAAAPV